MRSSFLPVASKFLWVHKSLSSEIDKVLKVASASDSSRTRRREVGDSSGEASSADATNRLMRSLFLPVESSSLCEHESLSSATDRPSQEASGVDLPLPFARKHVVGSLLRAASRAQRQCPPACGALGHSMKCGLRRLRHLPASASGTRTAVRGGDKARQPKAPCAADSGSARSALPTAAALLPGGSDATTRGLCSVGSAAATAR
mmetsp:Transcript_76369/g.218802  ORF Transcript_76369/g.218802 Transcript_76369/m.218802 type:complete len:204 (+) Transcript_76369:1069-1680(+)